MTQHIWPEQLVAYQSSPVFTEASVPTRLQKAHDTKAGTWAKLIVQTGALTYVVEESGVKQHVKAGNFALIFPQQLHHVEISEPVTFYLEFYRLPD